MEMYDPDWNIWSKWHELPDDRGSYAVALINKKLIILGGNNISRSLNTCIYLDLETLQWSSIAPMKTARSYLGAAVVKGHLYAVGGEGVGGDLNSVERFE